MGKVVTHTRTIFSYIYSVNNGDKNEGKDRTFCSPLLTFSSFAHLCYFFVKIVETRVLQFGDPLGPSSSTTFFVIVVRMIEARIKAKGCSGLLPPLDGHVIMGISKHKMDQKYVKSNLFRIDMNISRPSGFISRWSFYIYAAPKSSERRNHPWASSSA